MSKWNHKPKGQQPVDVKALERRKKSYAKHCLENTPEKVQKQRLEYLAKWKDIKSPESFWEFINKDTSNSHFFAARLMQCERNIWKMYPGTGCYALGNGHRLHNNDFSSNQARRSIIFMKKRKRTYFTAEEWREMIERMRLLINTSKAKIFTFTFCVEIPSDDELEYKKKYLKLYGRKEGYQSEFYSEDVSNEVLRNRLYPKLLEKERQAILDAGCEFYKDVHFYIVREHIGGRETVHECVGWEFRINGITWLK